MDEKNIIDDFLNEEISKEIKRKILKSTGRTGGRKSLRAEAKRNIKWEIRLSENERQKIRKLAKLKNLSMAQFVREASTNENQIQTKIASDEEKEILKKLIQCEVNFARISNYIKHKDGRLLDEIRDLRGEINKIIIQYGRNRQNNKG